MLQTTTMPIARPGVAGDGADQCTGRAEDGAAECRAGGDEGDVREAEAGIDVIAGRDRQAMATAAPARIAASTAPTAA
jgi:hypothetical protein